MALALLQAIDAGTFRAEVARALAVEVLRAFPPDDPAWTRAVAVLEGGAQRVRHAVELCGLVLDGDEAGAAGAG